MARIEYKGLFANIRFDDQVGGSPGWYAEYYDEDGTFSDSEKVGSDTMPTRRNASAKARAVAMRALREEWRRRRDRAKKYAG